MAEETKVEVPPMTTPVEPAPVANPVVTTAPVAAPKAAPVKAPVVPQNKPVQLPSAAELSAVLDDVEQETLKLAGVKNCNPFIYVRDNITPLREALKAGPVTVELVKKIKSVVPLRLPTPAAAKQ